MAQQPSQEREGLYGVDVSSLRMRELLEAHIRASGEGEKTKELKFKDGTRLLLVEKPLPEGARNLADCIDRSDPDHRELLKEHVLWRLAEQWEPKGATAWSQEELCHVRELTSPVGACIAFCHGLGVGFYVRKHLDATSSY